MKLGSCEGVEGISEVSRVGSSTMSSVQQRLEWRESSLRKSIGNRVVTPSSFENTVV